jgi:hypothetical protein
MSNNINAVETCSMSLRDWFAGQALAGLHAAYALSGDFPSLVNLERMAAIAYEQADKMLAERDKAAE